MAWLDKRGNSYRVVFQIGGRTLKRSLGTSDQREAQGKVATLERRLVMLERGELALPEEADLPDFLLNERKTKPVIAPPPSMHLVDAIASYLASIPAGSLEKNTVYTLRIHLRHVERVLGKSFRPEKLSFNELQRYVDIRSREKGARGQKLNAVTIRKELTSFSGLWSWLCRTGKCQGVFPNRGLRYPKTAEKPRFQTWTEIERQIARHKLNEAEQAELWSNLYLTTSEIDEVLTFVEQRAAGCWIYPMMLMAAHTGARRSELLRSQAADFDFDGGTVQIHEKKRIKGKSSSRIVPLSAKLCTVMRAWLSDSPRRTVFEMNGQPLSVDDAAHSITAILSDSKWSVVKGWHTFRHSFISNCASRGVDQRMIDAWVGHTTEEMRRRYRHLLPDAQQAALASVFGGQ